MEIEHIALDELKLFEANPRKITPERRTRLRRSLVEHGLFKPLLVWGDDNVIIGGNQRLSEMREMRVEGLSVPDPVPCVRYVGPEAKARTIAIRDNAQEGEWDWSALSGYVAELAAQDIELSLTGLDDDTIESLQEMAKQSDAALVALTGVGSEQQEEPGQTEEKRPGALAARFGVPPFTILDARQGYWQSRKKQWLALGIQSEVGRGENLLNFSDAVRMQRRIGHGSASYVDDGGTSIFDPVLCELAYRWFSRDGDLILDPFAGGSVRGICASALGRRYVGFELRHEQVVANRVQGERICSRFENKPTWIEGDSSDTVPAWDGVADMIFSCPPYFDLEQYSNDERDLSNLSWDGFLQLYRQIIASSVAKLRPDSFACFVVGDIRDKAGFTRGFVPETIRAFQDAGAGFYNDGILITSVGTLALRVARYFTGSRKLGRSHQNVLVFYKGDPSRIEEKFGRLGESEWPGVPERKDGADVR